MIEKRKKMQAQLAGSRLNNMPYQELVSPVDFYDKAVASEQARDTSLLEKMTAKPLEGIAFLFSDEYAKGKLADISGKIEAFEKTGMEKEASNERMRYAEVWNNHFFYKHLNDLIPAEVQPQFRAWQEASNRIARNSEERLAYEKARADYNASVLAYLGKKYPGVQKFDMSKLVERLYIIASEVINDDSYTTPVETTTKPYETFSNILPLLQEFRKMGLSPNQETPFHYMDFSSWFIVPGEFSEIFEQTLAELLMAEITLGAGLGEFNTSCVQLKKYLQDYEPAPEKVQLYFESAGRISEIEEFKRGKNGIYDVAFSLGAFDSHKKMLERIESFSR